MQILLMGIWMRSGISLWLWIGEDSAWLDVSSTICLSPLKSNNQSVCLFFQVISTLDAVLIRSGKNLQSNIHLNSNRFLFTLQFFIVIPGFWPRGYLTINIESEDFSVFLLEENRLLRAGHIGNQHLFLLFVFNLN